MLRRELRAMGGDKSCDGCTLMSIAVATADPLAYAFLDRPSAMSNVRFTFTLDSMAFLFGPNLGVFAHSS